VLSRSPSAAIPNHPQENNMKTLNTVAALAIAIAGLYSAKSAHAMKTVPDLHEQKFSRSLGLDVDIDKAFFDEKNHRISFAHFKHEVDAGRGFKIGDRPSMAGFIAMKLNDPSTSH
jgi:hypothetical protein